MSEHGTPPLSPGAILGPPWEEFPRQLTFRFDDDHTDPRRETLRMYVVEAQPDVFPDGAHTWAGKTHGFLVGQQIGDELTNKSLLSDGNRFHDAAHIALMTGLGWSPVMRDLLHIRHRSQPKIDETYDGPRAVIDEEGLISYVGRPLTRGTLQDGRPIDPAAASLLLDSAAETIGAYMPESVRPTPAEIEKALKVGYGLMKLLQRSIGMIDISGPEINSGYIHADLDRKEVRYSAQSIGDAKVAAPVEPVVPMIL